MCKISLNTYLTIVLSLLVAACTFDRAHLGDLLCSDSSDCPGAQCHLGVCQSGSAGDEVLDPASPEDGADFGPSPGNEPGPTDDLGPTTQPGDDEPADADPSPSEGDTVVPGDDESDVPRGCAGAENACGGCAPLSAAPGDPCDESECGVLQCQGTDELACVAGPVNACGGCEPLGGIPGDDCGGQCGGELQCDGSDAVTCVGADPNACGGCGGPDGELGATCLCGDSDVLLAESHRFSCDGELLSCSDGNDDAEVATELTDASDVMESSTTIAGSLAGGEESDWFVVYVNDDPSEDDGLLPEVSLLDLPRDLDLCAFWLYEFDRFYNLACAAGQAVVTDDGIPGCCSFGSGTSPELVSLRNDAWGSDRMDTLPGEDNDGGWLFIWVSGEPAEGCDTYELRYRF